LLRGKNCLLPQDIFKVKAEDDSQTADSFGQSTKGQQWPAAGLTGLVCTEVEHTQKKRVV
jgi:hypothetical protein